MHASRASTKESVSNPLYGVDRHGTIQAMLIGSSGSFETDLSPIECAERLNKPMRKFSFGSRADEHGFGLANSGRTMIRIVGTLRPEAGGTAVDYRVEFMPVALIAIASAFIVGTPVLAALIKLGSLPTADLAWLLVIVPAVAAANIWISERQAKWLREFLRQALDDRSHITAVTSDPSPGLGR
jgi:hypothetical protein